MENYQFVDNFVPDYEYDEESDSGEETDEGFHDLEEVVHDREVEPKEENVPKDADGDQIMHKASNISELKDVDGDEIMDKAWESMMLVLCSAMDKLIISGC